MGTGTPFGNYPSLRQALKAEPDNLDLKLQIKARQVYRMMKQRCTNPKNHAYPRYGGKGVELKIDLDTFVSWYVPKVKRWPSYLKRKDAPSVDRIRSNGHYEIGNIRIISLSKNVRRVYYRKCVKRPYLSEYNKKNRGVRIRLGKKKFYSIAEARRATGRSTTWIKNRAQRW